MKFEVGDVIRGVADTIYGITNDEAKMVVRGVAGDNIRVKVIDHIGNKKWVGEFFSVQAKYFTLVERHEDTKEEVNMKEWELLEQYTNKGVDLLRCMRVYDPTYKAVTKIMEAAYKAKTGLREVLRNHPAWDEEKQMIIFSAEYPRDFTREAIVDFANWLKYECGVPTCDHVCINITPENKDLVVNTLEHKGFTLTSHGQSYDKTTHNIIYIYAAECVYEYDRSAFVYMDAATFIDNADEIIAKMRNYTVLEFFRCHIRDVFFDETMERGIDVLNKYNDNFRLRTNMKSSKAILKICRELGWDKLGGTYIDPRDGRERKWFDKKYTELTDSINPLNITRHTIISINPIDFWTMSFGHKWSSCHTIDKDNVMRRGGSSYEGCYSGGTESYMLDDVSLVFYTVDKAYKGRDFEFEDKVNRCMFHIGEDKIVQGRVYPQGNDGATDLYKSIRETMQRVWSDAADISNLWYNIKGTDECDKVTRHHGVHYKDVLCYGDCNVSYHGGRDAEKNYEPIDIGADPICPCCGREHHEEESIECERCWASEVTCECCGGRCDQDDMHEIDGEWFCEDCCFYCDYHDEWERYPEDNYYVPGYGYVCQDALDYSDMFAECARCGEYHLVDNMIETDDGRYYCGEYCAHRDGYFEWYGDWYHENDWVVCSKCGELIPEVVAKEIGDLWCCEECASNVEEDVA